MKTDNLLAFTKRISYNNTEFSIPTLYSEDGFYIEQSRLKEKIIPVTNAYQKTTFMERLTTWNIKRFETPRLPLIVGEVGDKKSFSINSNLRILDMPIKFPGSNYRLPLECAQFTMVIKEIISHELTFNRLTNDFFAYLTIDQQPIKKGETQRKPGLHVDGFQGARIFPKGQIDHSYVVSDCLPTIFYRQAFFMDHLDESKHNFFLEFDKQSDERMTWKPLPYLICLLSAYQVHRSDYASEDTSRTFLRLSFSKRQFDRLGNTHNPLFDYNWEMVPRDTQSKLVRYI